ncbi:MAG: hypothetical protein JO263_06100 [Candidatus Eremiobacteraeota bacterium]|nr:hypothetical protein [Candidatus Eremiobacteraeota bacterium]
MRPAHVVAGSLIAIGLALFPAPGFPQSSPSPAPSATPAVRSFVMLEDEYTPYYEQTGHGGNSLDVTAQMRLVAPLTGELYLLRIKIPFTTWAPASAATGGGDTTILALTAARPTAAYWSLGLCASLPTGNLNSLGSGKWAGGPAVQYGFATGRWSAGFTLRQYFSIAGNGARTPYVRTDFTPSIVYDLGGGWYAGNSKMSFKYDWYSGRWLDVPLGLSVGKKLYGSLRGIDTQIEAERNLANYLGSPEYTFRAQVKYSL